MMNMEDTIAAISSAAPRAGMAAVSIVRISGPGTFELFQSLFPECLLTGQRGITHCTLQIKGISVPAAVYTFCPPHSYTGQELIELHVTAAGCVVDALLEQLLSRGRAAEPGEFTWRAYINGRMDLTQAEAVAQIVSGSNAAQLAAAEKLLAGSLSQTIGAIRREILDLLSRIEAGLDFAEEDIEFISAEQAAGAAESLAARLEELLGSTIQYERMIDLPSAGIAGAVNAGKSSLLNALLGRDRSIVSEVRATTRDVLAEILSLGDMDCVVFDCAGLGEGPAADDPLDGLARQTALSTLEAAEAVLFCADITKEDLSDDRAACAMLRKPSFLAIATKCDRLSPDELPARLRQLEQAFGFSFLPTSARTGAGLEELKEALRKMLLDLRGAGAEADQRIAVNQRHRQILSDAAGAIGEAGMEIQKRNDEIASMLLRAAWQQLGGIEREDIEESILEQIFSRFCVGK